MTTDLTNELRRAVQDLNELRTESERLTRERDEALRQRNEAIAAHQPGHYTNDAHVAMVIWGKKAAALAVAEQRLSEARDAVGYAERALVTYFIEHSN